MTAKPQSRKADPGSRHPYGPRAIGAVLPAVTRHAYRSQGVATAQLLMDWPAIVGQALAAGTMPRRLAAGTLTLSCAGPIALELQHLAAPLMERINTHLGRSIVQRLRFVQEAIGTARASAPVRMSAPAPVHIEGMADGPLKAALASLGAAVGPERA